MANVNHSRLMNGITSMMNSAEPVVAAECCIYRAPYGLRKLNEDAYTPNVVSIGPLHYGNPRLRNMQRHKLTYLKNFIERAATMGTSLDSLVTSAQYLSPSVRLCYSEAIDLSEEELIKVILVDACFIFELFWRDYYVEWSASDVMLFKPWLRTNIRLDLLLLENQLPFFVFEGLFSLVFRGRIPIFLELAVAYFKFYNKQNMNITSARHFTDLIRTFYLQPMDSRPNRGPKKGGSKEETYLPTASDLLASGVKFKFKDSPCLLDLKFSGRVLKIPRLKVEDGTETVFRNLVALEQCHYPDESYIIDYVAVLDFLVNTERDVDVLINNGIIVNWLGDSNAAADMFNGLGKNVIEANFHSQYFQLCKDLNGFYHNWWHQKKATLKQGYFRTAWQSAASIGGIILLVLTLIQTICSVIEVSKDLNLLKFTF